MVYALLIALYSSIGGLYYHHNRNMGSCPTGIIMASLWLIVALLWCWGFYLVWREDVEMEQILREYKNE